MAVTGIGWDSRRIGDGSRGFWFGIPWEGSNIQL